MIGFIILFFICIAIVFLLKSTYKFAYKHDLEPGWWFLGVCSAIAAIVFLCLVVFSPLQVNRNIEDFKEYKGYIEELYVFENEDKCIFMQDENYDSLTKCVADTSVYQEILDYNMWLTESRASKRGYGIFSFYRYKDLDDLEYIEIGD